MRLYLGTSALVKLYVEEEGSALVRRATDQAGLVATSAVAYVEVRAAFVRRRYDRGLSAADYRGISRDLDADWTRYVVMKITNALIRQAGRLTEGHRLRAYDGVHLASAAVLRGRLVEPVVFASWDLGLEKAAKAEGLAPLGSSRR